jgi:hypothetical protein
MWISSHNAVAMGSYPVNLARQCARAVGDWLSGASIAHTVLDVPPVPADLMAAISSHPRGADAR